MPPGRGFECTNRCRLLRREAEEARAGCEEIRRRARDVVASAERRWPTRKLRALGRESDSIPRLYGNPENRLPTEREAILLAG
jgi:hypothetical protein